MSLKLDAKSETSRNMEGAESLEFLEDIPGNRQTDGIHEQIKEERRARMSQQVFTNPLILKGILKWLDREDLLQTSLINKYWNFLSREVLRENEKCLAVVNISNFCRNLNRLNALLLNSDNVLFNGISFAALKLSASGRQHCLTSAELNDLLNNIVRKIDFKYLSYKPMCRKDKAFQSCYPLLNIRKIIVENSGTLEGLTISTSCAREYSRQAFSNYLDLHLQGSWLPSIRILELPFGFYPRFIPLSLIEDLVKASPKLQELYGNIDSLCLEIILRLKVAKAVKGFVFEPRIDCLRRCADFSLENPQLNRLTFSTIQTLHSGDPRFSDWSEIRQNEVSRILKQLLECSQNSLKTFSCDHCDLILMTSRWNITVWKKLVCFKLKYNSEIDDREGYHTLKKIEWGKYFPNLREVCLKYTYSNPCDDGIDFYINQAFRQSKVEFVCESVKILHWELLENTEKIEMFKTIFPNVKDFHLKLRPEFPHVMNQLWTAWRDLESIYASFSIEVSIPNFDAVFLGVSEEEAAYLLENVEELEALEIVSTGPSIFNLRMLKKLVLNVTHDADVCRGTNSASDQVFFSRLTGQCAFARIPGLVVDIYSNLCKPVRNCRFALDHIRPFLRVE